MHLTECSSTYDGSFHVHLLLLLLLQIYFYQSARCRTEMFDKDILMIQVQVCMSVVYVSISHKGS